jgi:spermidine/putrescine transport system permease protein
MRRALALLLTLPAIFTVLAPVATMLLLSFCSSRFPSLPWPGWSSVWYQALVGDTLLQMSLMRSTGVGLACATISTLLGFGSSLLISQVASNKVAAPLLSLSLPSLLPFIIVGFAFMGFANLVGILRTTGAVIIAHCVVFSPVVTTIFLQRMRALNPEVEEAAWELGASRLMIWSIIAGQMKSTAIASALVVFVLSWDEYVISSLVSGFSKTYPVYVRTILEATFSPEIYAIGSIVAIFSFMIVATAVSLARK